MKTVFVPVKYKGKISLPEKLINLLPKRIVLATTIQFIDFVKEIKKQLKNKKIILFRGRSKTLGQILGCDLFKIKKNFDAFLFIGDGLFHPQALLYFNQKPVFCFNPLNERFFVLGEKEFEKIKKQIEAARIKFLYAQKTGVLVSLKPGQKQLNLALKIKRVLEKKGKEAYLFIGDTLDLKELDNFSFIQVWINTACPRIFEDDKRIVNWWMIKDFLKE